MGTILDAIGKTPLLMIDGISVKQEFLNPSGSIKDRIAKYIVEQAERSGKLKKGFSIIEATSGNTGIAFSLVASVKGYRMIAAMPEGLSIERQEIMRAYGAEIHLVKEGCVGCAVDYARDYARKNRKVYWANQFANQWNINENEKILGKEILSQVPKIDAFVAGVGTGGTLIGVGRAIRKKFPKAKLIAVEPAECPMMSEAGIGHHTSNIKLYPQICRKHRIEGIGDGFIPDIIKKNKGMIDEVIKIKSADAIGESKRIAQQHGLLVGISSGANLLAAKHIKKEFNLKNVVTVFPDSGMRYLSEGYF